MTPEAFPRICISSTQGGGGKTLLSLGLTRAFANAGVIVKPFKKGPDFIDTAWLSQAARRAATNLDPFFFSREQLTEIFCQTMAGIKNPGPKLAIVEGNRGLYDGLNETGVCSTSQVARAIACPILLCIDCRKATRTIAAIINGLTKFECDLAFAGVILNRVGSSRHEISLRKAIEANSDAPVLGCLPKLPDNPIPERHMGLIACDSEADNDESGVLNQLASFIKEHCDLERIWQAAAQAPQLTCPIQAESIEIRTKTDNQPNIGVIRDKAFWFYYPENLDALRTAGANIVHLSILDNSNANLDAWQELDGLYLGGGFPEDHPEKLSQSPFLKLLKRFAAAQMPIYAECGGMILLCQSLEINGRAWPMSGILPAAAIWTTRPQGLGYVQGQIVKANAWYETGLKVKAHEFHYSRCHWPGQAPNAVLELERGQGIYQEKSHNYDGICVNNVWASYAHIFAPAVPEWAPRFIELARPYRKKRLATTKKSASCRKFY